MRRFRLGWAFLLVFGASACSMVQTSPYLARWEGRRFVVCCENRPDRLTNCGRDAWVEAIKQHCRGGAKAVSGASDSRAVGMHVDATAPMYPGDGGSLDMSTYDSKNQCVQYECTVDVVP